MNEKINTKHALFINWIPPFIKVLKEKGGSATPKEIREGIIDKMKLDDNFLAERHEKSKQLKFENQVYWAKQYLAWEELVKTSKRGIWELTAKGWETSIGYEDALALINKWVKIHKDTRENKQTVSSTHAPEAEETEAELEPEIETEIMKDSLLEILKKTTPTGFEHLCGRLLREYDFEDIEITPRSHDGGIDGTAVLKLNSFVNMSVYFQCKKYDGAVPIGHIREFIGVLATEQNGVDRGLFITTGTLPKAAYEMERKNTRLELIDGEKLVEMFEKAEIGVNPRTVYDPDMAFFASYMRNEESK